MSSSFLQLTVIPLSLYNMTMTFYTIYMVLLFASGLMSIALAGYGWQHRHQVGARYFIGWMGCAVMWSLGAAFSAISTSPPIAQFFTRIAFIGVSFVPVFLFMFVLEYTGRLKWLSSRWIAIYMIVPVITQILHWIPVLQPFFMKAVYYEQIGAYYFLVKIDRAPWFWVHTAYGYGLILIGLGLLVLQAIRTVTPYRQQALILFFGALIPVATNVIVISGSSNGLDWTPIAFVFVSLTWGLTLYRYRFFDIMPVARDAIVESMDDAVIVLDMQNRILDMNPAAQDLTPHNQTTFIGEPLTAVFPSQINIINQFISTNESQTEIMIGEPGSQRHFDLRISPLRRRKEQIGRLIVLRDTTDQVLLIQELDAYAHTVAHDLKSPLTVITGYMQLIETIADGQLDDTLLDYLHRVLRTSNKMTQIINTLLLFASIRRQSDLILTPINSEKLVTEALERTAVAIKEKSANVEITTDHWPVVYGYAPWVEEVWVNYISNAVKYGGTPPQITLGYDDTDDDFIRFWVQDNGRGLSEEEQSQLFLQFSRLEPAKAEGHGLGLSIVLRIVEKLGGEVGIDSQPDHGSQFWFTLPTSRPN